MVQRARQYAQADGATTLHGGDEDAAVRFVLTPAAAATRVEIKEGGASGPVVLTIQAAANGASVVVDTLTIGSPYLATFTGAGAVLSVLK